MADRIRDTKAMADTAKGMLRSAGGSFMEHRTRRECHFDDVESKLPNLRTATASDKRPTEAQDILSYLGSWNPLGQKISGNDTVWLFDNTAYRNAKTGEWEAEFVAAVFDQNTGLEVSAVVADVAEKVGLGKGNAAEAMIRERLLPFMQTILPGRVVTVAYGGTDKLKLGPGSRNGISSDIKPVMDKEDGSIMESRALVPEGANGILGMKTAYAEPEGWGLISDIDDSIKITQTSSPIGILRTTFVDTPTPIAGMPEFYSYVQKLITPSSPFFYLSASPYNLYSFLKDFRNKFYPQGTIILRDASWMNLRGLLSNLTLGTQEYKVDRMTKIHLWLPRRKMICVGDSTQMDPESYGEIARKHPGWIKLILIRKVTDIAAVGIAAKNEPARFEKAFKGLPSNLWYVFETPEECYQIVKDVVARG